MATDPPLLRNPFHLLGVSSRDTRHRIVEAAEERAVIHDGELCSKAGSDLTNPRSRVAAEVAWLPGLSPRRASQMIDELVLNPSAVIRLEGVPLLARSNLLGSAILGLTPDQPDADWVYAIVTLGRTVDKIDPEAVVRDINEDRKVAGFTEVKAVEPVEEALAERRREYRDCIKAALDKLPPEKLAKVCAAAVNESTNGGNVHAPLLIDELVDGYAVETHTFFVQEAENVRKLITRALEVAPKGLQPVSPVLDRLEAVLKNWAFVAQPIQLSAKAQGTTHELSKVIAGEVRGLGVELFNKYDLLDCSQRIVSMLKALFETVSEIADIIADDSRTLDGLARKRDIERRLEAIFKMCTDIAETTESSPASGAGEARSLLDQARDQIARLVKEGIPSSGIDQAKDAFAFASLRCAFAYGHKTLKWSETVALLEEAVELTSNEHSRDTINGHLQTARERKRVFAGLSTISSAPTLATINGCGFTVYGSTDPDPGTGSHMATYYFVLFFLPIFPICRYRVISLGNSYRFLGKGSLRPFDKLYLAASLIIITFIIFSSLSR
ncbi:MAG: hypothetical protein ABSC06_03770 [Rhodopila sp.]